MDIYLDIDGVLLSDAIGSYGRPAECVLEFLKFVTERHDCYWLTTHCMNGENHVKEFLQKKLPPEAMQYVALIKPLNWKEWKTEAIDFTKDFRWIDDDVYEPEEKILRKHNCEDKLIKINLQENPNQLKDILKQL
ncbi:MAG: hypothetical protein NTV36_01480 [Candidatus Staskawiczbacteria bacterium]|nr:hypothetical protein [Candidatus Staskawiczbacteria bacterium]